MNQSYTPTDALSYLAAVDDYAFQFIEHPCAHDADSDVRRFLQLKRQRSARRMQDARRRVETLNGAVGLGNRLSYMYGTALAWN